MTWELLWQIVFVVFTTVFAIMAVAITFLGARDIRRLVQKLQEQEPPEKDS